MVLKPTLVMRIQNANLPELYLQKRQRITVCTLINAMYPLKNNTFVMADLTFRKGGGIIKKKGESLAKSSNIFLNFAS